MTLAHPNRYFHATVLPHTTTCYYILVHTTTYHNIRRHTTTYDHDYIRPHTTTYDHILLHTTTYYCILLPTAAYYILHTTNAKVELDMGNPRARTRKPLHSSCATFAGKSQANGPARPTTECSQTTLRIRMDSPRSLISSNRAGLHDIKKRVRTTPCLVAEAAVLPILAMASCKVSALITAMMC